MTRLGSGFALNKPEGKIMGVCAGIADWIGVDALWVRVAAVALTVLVTKFMIPIYLIVGFLAPKRLPMAGYDGIDDARGLTRDWRRRERQDAGAGLSDLDQRVSEMERSVRGQ